MSRIIEITPTGRTAYDMPEELAEVVCHALNRARLINFCPRGVGAIIAMLPPEHRAEVTITPLPAPEPGVAGLRGDVIIDEVLLEEAKS
jgi:hypothetical protein